MQQDPLNTDMDLALKKNYFFKFMTIYKMLYY